MPAHAPDPELERVIHDEASRALARGTVAFSVTGAVGSLIALVISVSRPAIRWPGASVLVIAAFGFALAWLAHRRRLSVPMMRVGLLVFLTLPFLSLVTSAGSAPLGTATFLFGPIPQIFVVIIILTGLTFDPRLSRMAGMLGAVLSFGAHAWSREQLAGIEGLDDDLHFELADPGIALLRALVVVGAGFLTAAAADTANRLLRRVRDEETQRQQLNRLFGQYVSDDVRDKVVREGGLSTGERHVVAVLFSDLRGFTTWSEQTKPAEVVHRLNQYFERMVAAIEGNGGTVDKFIGDAVMAVFGGVRPLDRPADAALAAARAMRAELAALNAQWARAGLPPLDNGIGVHFGEVLQGPIGAASRKEFTVIGDTVNTASRLESATKELAAGVVLSEAAAAALSPAARASLRPLGEVTLKGKAQPVVVFSGDASDGPPAPRAAG